MSTEQITAPQPVTIVEKIERKILRPLMKNFRSTAEAIFETVDNPVDQFDGHRGGSFLSISIDVRRDKDLVVVENVGGRGMGPEELQDWLDWGRTASGDGISEYGQGGKAAMGYLGNAWIIRTKRYDDPWLWELRDDDWSDATVAVKSWTAEPVRVDEEHEGVGYCRIEIRKLWPRKHLGPEQLTRLKVQIGNVYRTLLEGGALTITVNGQTVTPLELPLYEGHRKRDIAFKAAMGWSARGWLGRLKRDARARTPIPIRAEFD